MPENEIKEQLGKYKERVRQQLGDPNRRQTWLEELAEAQAKDCKTMPKKTEATNTHQGTVNPCLTNQKGEPHTA